MKTRKSKWSHGAGMLACLCLAMALFSACGKASEETAEVAEPTVVAAETTATPEPTAEEATETPTPTETPETAEMPNPWSETQDLEEAMKGSGIRFSPPVEQAIPQGRNLQFQTYRFMPGTIESLYRGGDEEFLVRASLNLQGDALSGDMNVYSQTWEETLKGLVVTCRGDGEKINTATFDADTVHFSVLCDPGKEKEQKKNR